MYGVIFTRMSGNKREPGTSDETDEEEDDETDETSTVQPSRQEQLGDLVDPNANFSR